MWRVFALKRCRIILLILLLCGSFSNVYSEPLSQGQLIQVKGLVQTYITAHISKLSKAEADAFISGIHDLSSAKTVMQGQQITLFDSGLSAHLKKGGFDPIQHQNEITMAIKESAPSVSTTYRRTFNTDPPSTFPAPPAPAPKEPKYAVLPPANFDGTIQVYVGGSETSAPLGTGIALEKGVQYRFVLTKSDGSDPIVTTFTYDPAVIDGIIKPYKSSLTNGIGIPLHVLALAASKASADQINKINFSFGTPISTKPSNFLSDGSNPLLADPEIQQLIAESGLSDTELAQLFDRVVGLMDEGKYDQAFEMLAKGLGVTLDPEELKALAEAADGLTESDPFPLPGVAGADPTVRPLLDTWGLSDEDARREGDLAIYIREGIRGDQVLQERKKKVAFTQELYKTNAVELDVHYSQYRWTVAMRKGKYAAHVDMARKLGQEDKLGQIHAAYWAARKRMADQYIKDRIALMNLQMDRGTVFTPYVWPTEERKPVDRFQTWQGYLDKFDSEWAKILARVPQIRAKAGSSTSQLEWEVNDFKYTDLDRLSNLLVGAVVNFGGSALSTDMEPVYKGYIRQKYFNQPGQEFGGDYLTKTVAWYEWRKNLAAKTLRDGKALLDEESEWLRPAGAILQTKSMKWGKFLKDKVNAFHDDQEERSEWGIDELRRYVSVSYLKKSGDWLVHQEASIEYEYGIPFEDLGPFHMMRKMDDGAIVYIDLDNTEKAQPFAVSTLAVGEVNYELSLIQHSDGQSKRRVGYIFEDVPIKKVSDKLAEIETFEHARNSHVVSMAARYGETVTAPARYSLQIPAFLVAQLPVQKAPSPPWHSSDAKTAKAQANARQAQKLKGLLAQRTSNSGAASANALTTDALAGFFGSALPTGAEMAKALYNAMESIAQTNSAHGEPGGAPDLKALAQEVFKKHPENVAGGTRRFMEQVAQSEDNPNDLTSFIEPAVAEIGSDMSSATIQFEDYLRIYRGFRILKQVGLSEEAFSKVLKKMQIEIVAVIKASAPGAWKLDELAEKLFSDSPQDIEAPLLQLIDKIAGHAPDLKVLADKTKASIQNDPSAASQEIKALIDEYQNRLVLNNLQAVSAASQPQAAPAVAPVAESKTQEIQNAEAARADTKAVTTANTKVADTDVTLATVDANPAEKRIAAQTTVADVRVKPADDQSQEQVAAMASKSQVVRDTEAEVKPVQAEDKQADQSAGVAKKPVAETVNQAEKAASVVAESKQELGQADAKAAPAAIQIAETASVKSVGSNKTPAASREQAAATIAPPVVEAVNAPGGTALVLSDSQKSAKEQKKELVIGFPNGKSGTIKLDDEGKATWKEVGRVMRESGLSSADVAQKKEIDVTVARESGTAQAVTLILPKKAPEVVAPASTVNRNLTENTPLVFTVSTQVGAHSVAGVYRTSNGQEVTVQGSIREAASKTGGSTPAQESTLNTVVEIPVPQEIAKTAGQYSLKVTVEDVIGNIGVLEVKDLKVQLADLRITDTPKNFPNPFSPIRDKQGTAIMYTLSKDADTRLFIFDASGQMIVRKNMSSGTEGSRVGLNQVPWDGKSDYGYEVGNGVYSYVISDGTKILGRGQLTVVR